jgi:hypothetical protein
MITLLYILTLLVILSLYFIKFPDIQNTLYQNVIESRAELSQNKTSGNFSGNASEPSIVEGLGKPRELAHSNGLDKLPLKARNIAMELTDLSPVEIRQYPIILQSSGDIRSVLSLLNPHNLAKVLLNISQEDLLEIQNILSPSAFKQILNKLPDANRTQVQDRLS